MPEAVIVSAARSPIGRANKGSLRHAPRRPGRADGRRPRSDKVPALDPTDIDDLMLGCGLPGGEPGFNMARVVAVLLGLRRHARHHGHPVLLVAPADHADGAARDQGRRGRRLHLRRCRERVPVRQRAVRRPARHAEPAVRRRRGAHREAAEGGAAPGPTRASDGLVPDVYIAMGQTAENVAQLKGITREEQDEFGVRSQNLAEKAIANGFFDARDHPGDAARRHGGQHRRRPAAGDHAREGVSQLKPVFRPGRHRHRRQLLPAQRRRRRAGDHVRHQGQGAGADPAGPDRVHRRVRRCRRRSWAWARSRPSKQALARAGMTIDDIDLVEINEAFAVQVIGVGPRARHRRGQAQRQRRRDRARAPVRHDRRADHDHADQLAAVPRQAVRARDHVRRRRPGHGDGPRAL